MVFESYPRQLTHWPTEGRHILAQFDDATVTVYQAYREDIAAEALTLGRFGGRWSRTRMSWVKPNFLWMMYRSGWATKPDQEHVLAIRMMRSGFDELLAAAVPSTFYEENFPTRSDWEKAVARSDVRLQWDPDHNPQGHPVARRAIQLGIRGPTLARFCDEWIVGLDDVTDFVHQQHERLKLHGVDALELARERVYPVRDETTLVRLGMKRSH